MNMHLSHDFLFSKVHGRWAASFRLEDIERLLRSGDLDGLRRALTDAGVATEQRAGVQRKLTERLIEEVGTVRDLAPPDGTKFFDRFVDKYFFENLKTILHYRYFPQQGKDIRLLLVESSYLPNMDAPLLLEARSVHEFYRHLPPHSLKNELLPLLVELDDTHDLFVTESRLNALYYRWLLESIPQGAGNTFKQTARELATTEIEIDNIVMALRNVAVYHLAPEQIEELAVPGGPELSVQDVRRLCESNDRHGAVEQLPPVYRRRLQPLVNDPVYRSENALWTMLYRKACDAFRDFNHPARSLAAFPYLKRTEALNLGRLFEGLYLQLSPAIIRTMLIGMT